MLGEHLARARFEAHLGEAFELLWRLPRAGGEAEVELVRVRVRVRVTVRVKVTVRVWDRVYLFTLTLALALALPHNLRSLSRLALARVGQRDTHGV